MKTDIKPANGKLGILIPGLGAVATTLIAGVEAIKKGISQPIGSLTQMGNIHLNRKNGDNYPKIKEFVPLANLEDVVFGGWDVYVDNVYEAAMKAKVLEPGLLNSVKAELEKVVPMKAAFDQFYAKNLVASNVKTGTRHELAQQVMDDIKNFKETNGCDRIVLIWCGSTEVYYEKSDIHNSVAQFEQALLDDDKRISPSMIYAYAALKMGIPFANGAPNLTVDIPAMIELAKQTETPIAGKDFKTG